MLFLKQPLVLPLLCNKSATTFQVDSYKVSDTELKPDLYSCAKTEVMESTLRHNSHTSGAQSLWDTLHADTTSFDLEL